MFGNFMIGVKSKDICKTIDVYGIEHAYNSVFFNVFFLIMQSLQFYRLLHCTYLHLTLQAIC